MREFRVIDQQLLENLQKGGHILYIRHGEAIIGIDQQKLLWEDCRTQRNLSEKGRKQAYEYGILLRKWDIPIEIPVRPNKSLLPCKRNSITCFWQRFIPHRTVLV